MGTGVEFWQRWGDLGELAVESAVLVLSLLAAYGLLIIRQREQDREWRDEEAARRRRRDRPAVYGGSESDATGDP